MKNSIILLILLFSFEVGLTHQSRHYVRQDSTDLKLGIGLSLGVPLWGPNFTLFYHGYAIDITYGLPRTSSGTTNRIIEVDRGARINLAYHFRRPLLGHLPYFGAGYVYVDESDKVKGYTGKGVITGYHYFVGMRSLSSRVISRRLGTNIELGRSVWDYDNSLLVKINSDLNYHYPSFYFSFGISYYFK